MERDDPNAKLSELQTQTTLLYDAQNGTPEQSDADLGPVLNVINPGNRTATAGTPSGTCARFGRR